MSAALADAGRPRPRPEDPAPIGRRSRPSRPTAGIGAEQTRKEKNQASPCMRWRDLAPPQGDSGSDCSLPALPIGLPPRSVALPKTPVARYSRLRFPVLRVSPEAGFPGSASLDGCYFLSSRRRAWQDFPASSGKNFLTHRPIHSSILVILQLTPDLHKISTA